MRLRLVLLLPALVAPALLAAAPGAASAAVWDCEASAVVGSVLGAAGVEPVTANRGAVECAPDAATGDGSALGGGPPVIVGAFGAQTASEGPAGPPDERRVSAIAGASNLSVRSLPDLPLALPTASLDGLQAVMVALPSLPGLPESLTLDLRPAIRALMPDRRLPVADVVSVRRALAFAVGRCVGGQPRLTGATDVAGIQVLGDEVPTGQAVERTVTLLGAAQVDPSGADLRLIELPAGLSFDDPLLGPVLRTAVQEVLDGLADVVVPPALANVRIVPGAQESGPGRLVQRALEVHVSVAGQPLADLAIGRAAVGADAVQCTALQATTAGDLALACTDRDLVLVEVVPGRKRVHLLGYADRRFVGRTVSLRFRATGRRVARATVRPDGSFRASAPMPSRRLRASDRARYQAVLGSERSLDLKLQRRMRVTSMTVRDGRVRIRGRVTRPLSRPLQRVTVSRRLSCSRSRVVARVRPRRDGTFSVSVPAPEGQSAAVYRLSTKVRATERNPKLFPTFTLPRGVNL